MKTIVAADADLEEEKCTARWPIGFWVAVGSGAGGGARIVVAFAALSMFGAGFPYGVLIINILGSFLIGLVAALTAPDGRWLLSPAARQGLMAGFCGGFTTFSFFSLQTLQLLQDERWLAASIYAGATLLFSLAAVWLGYVTGKRVQKPGLPLDISIE